MCLNKLISGKQPTNRKATTKENKTEEQQQDFPQTVSSARDWITPGHRVNMSVAFTKTYNREK